MNLPCGIILTEELKATPHLDFQDIDLNLAEYADLDNNPDPNVLEHLGINVRHGLAIPGAIKIRRRIAYNSNPLHVIKVFKDGNEVYSGSHTGKGFRNLDRNDQPFWRVQIPVISSNDRHMWVNLNRSYIRNNSNHVFRIEVSLSNHANHTPVKLNITISHNAITLVRDGPRQQPVQDIVHGTYIGDNYPKVRGWSRTVFQDRFPADNIESKLVISATEQRGSGEKLTYNWVRVGTTSQWRIGDPTLLGSQSGSGFSFGHWNVFPAHDNCYGQNAPAGYDRCYHMEYQPNKTNIDALYGNATLTLEMAHIENGTEYLRKKITYTITGQVRQVPTVVMTPDTATAAGITEGAWGIINFDLGRTTTSPLSIVFDVTQTGNFTNSTEFSIPVNRNQSSGRVTVVTINDNIDEADGTITVSARTPVSGAPYRLSEVASEISITFNVADNDKPTISIARHEDTPATLTEKPEQYAEFLVTASIAPYQRIEVVYNARSAGKFTLANVTRGRFYLDAGDTTVKIRIKTRFDPDYNNNNGPVIADLHASEGNHYNLHSDGAKRTASVTLVNQDRPVITIVVNSNSSPRVIEADNTNVTFDINATFNNVMDGLSIKVDIAETGDFVADESQRTVDLAINVTSGTLEIPITNDNTYELNGTLTATLVADTSTPRVFDITNNAAAQKAVAVIVDDEVPTISISAHSDSTPHVNEAPDASIKYVFAADKAPLADLTIIIDVTETNDGTGDFLDESLTKYDTHTFTAGSRESIRTIDLDFDETTEADGKIKVTVQDDTEVSRAYLVTQTVADQSAEINIKANTLPIISIARDPSNSASIAEGENIVLNFQVTSNQSITGSNLVVNISVSETQNMLVAEAMRATTATINIGATTGTYSVSVNNDDIDEVDSEVTATVSADSNATKKYFRTITVANRSAQITVTDEDIPEVSVNAPNIAIYEQPGGVARFEVSSDIKSTKGVTVNFNVTHVDENFIDQNITLPTSTTIMGESLKSIVDIILTFDRTAEPEGKVKLTLFSDGLSGINYTITQTTAEQSATITITGSTVPVISIEANSESAGGVTEAVGAVVKFNVNATFSEAHALTVGVQITEPQSSNFLRAANQRPTSVTIAANTTSKTFEVQVVEDESNEVDGEVTATLQADTAGTATYVVNTQTNLNSATVALTDDDTPVISIAVHADSTPHVLELPGAKVKYAITSTYAPYQDLTIEFAIANDQGDYLHGTQTSPIPENVVLTMGSTSINVEAPIQYRPAANGTGMVKATLEDHATDTTLYSISSTTAEQSATATINDNPNPYISIAVHSSSSSGVQEADGAVAKFTISATLPIPAGTTTTVHYTITESHSFIQASQATTGTVDLDSSNQSRDVDVAIANDMTNEADGTITITLNDDSNDPSTYVIPPVAADQKATVSVTDNDLPVISVAEHESAKPFVIETQNGNVRFTITSTFAPYEDLTIEFAVTELMSTTYLPASGVPSNVVLRANMSSVEVSVPIHYDEVADGGDGQFKLTLENHATDTSKYNISSIPAEQTATAEIKNDDGMPIISVAVLNPPANGFVEGTHTSVTFSITSVGNIDPSATVSIPYTVTESHAFLATTNTLSGTVMLTSTTTFKNLPFTFHNDTADEADGTVTLTITADTANPPTYAVQVQSATANIKDEDVPEISIAVHDDSDPHVLEDRNVKVKFAITSNIAPYQDLTIEFAITNFEGTYLHGTVSSPIPENVVLKAGLTSVDIEAPLQYRPADNGVGKVKATLEVHATDTTLYDITTTTAEQSATATINNNNKPYITIAAHSSPASGVTEADDVVAKFTISSTLAIPTGTSVTVGYTISESHAFIKTPYTPNGTVVLDPSNQSRDVDVAIDNDDTDEVNGSITITLKSDTSGSNTYYIPALAAEQKASVNVTDDDVPEISVAVHESAKPYVIETNGGSVRFTITSTIAHYEDLTIEFAVTELMSTTYLPSANVPESVVLPANMTSVHVDVPISYNEVADGGDGQFKLTLENHATDTTKYDITSTPAEQSATAEIRNDDGIPIVSVAPHTDSASGVTEADNAEIKFTISAIGAIDPMDPPISVSYTVTESHAFLKATNTLSGSVEFNSTTSSHDISLEIDNDDADEANGMVTLTLAEDTNDPITYDLSTRSADVSVKDDDIPAISIAVHADSTPHVLEDRDAKVKFAISSSIAPYEDITIEFAITNNQGTYLHGTQTSPIPENVVLTAGTRSANVEAPLQYRPGQNNVGKVQAALEVHASDTTIYELTSVIANRSAIATINNNPKPYITIVPHSSSASGVTEADGAVAKFTIGSTLPIPTGTSVTVGYTISESHKFIETPYTANGTVVLDPENQSRDIDVTIDSDIVDEVNGTITMTLNSDTSGSNSYYIPEMAANQKATVNVMDDDVPTLSVAVHENSKPYVIETDGGMVRFTITSTIAHYEDLTIEFAVTAPIGDYLPTTYVTENVVLPAGMTTIDVDVPMNYDADTVDGTGEFKLTLEPHATDTTKYDVSVSPTNRSATAEIRNNDGIPVISLEVVSPPANGFTEGSNTSVMFSITSSGTIDPSTPLTIPYTVSESHAFLASTNTLSGNATLNSTTASLNFELTIEDDDVNEADGTITFTITADTADPPTYAVQTPSLVVDVKDDDVPALSIAVHAESTPNVTESPSAVAKFTLTASPAPYENITIEFDVTTTGDYLPATGVPSNIELVKDTTSINVEVPVKYNKANLPDGTITVTLENHATDTSKYSIPTLPAEQSVQVDIINNTLPQITIAPHTDSAAGVDEADNAVAKFTISSNIAISSGTTLNVGYSVTESHDFLPDSQAELDSVPLEMDNQSKVVSIPIENDDEDEANGTITLTLKEDSNSQETYLIPVALDERKAVVNVRDDEVPALTIATHEDSLPSIIESPDGYAKYLITAIPAPYEEIRIEIGTDHETFSYIADTGVPEYVTMAAHETTATVQIPIKFVNSDDADGKIKVTLNDHATDTTKYSIPTEIAERTAEVLVVNSEIPLVSVSVHADSASGVEEADNAMVKFTVSSSSPLEAGTTFEIQYTISESHAFILSNHPLTGSVRLDSQNQSAPIDVPLESDEIDEMNGTITVTLTADTSDLKKFNVPASPTATANVMDDDLPQISIARHTDTREMLTEIPELVARFTVTSDRVSFQDLVVGISVTESQNQNFLPVEDQRPTSAIITQGATSADVDVAIDYGPNPGETSIITVTLAADSLDPITYELSTAPNSTAATVNVEGSAIPVISISVHEDSLPSVKESSSLKFVIEATIAPQTDLMVKFGVSETAEFLITEAKSKSSETLSTGATSVVVTLKLVNDIINEVNGTVTVTLEMNTGQNYIIHPNAEENTATAQVRDDDLPIISIAIDSTSQATIGEGSNIVPRFKLTASTTTIQDINVYVQIEVRGNLFANSYSKPITVLIATDSTENTFDVPLLPFSRATDHEGHIDATIIAEPTNEETYYPTGEDTDVTSRINIKFAQRQQLSVALFETISPITENGGMIKFKISADIPSEFANSFDIHYELTPVGNFINQEDLGKSTISMETSESDVEIILRIEDDTVDEANGSIAITLKDDPASVASYRVNEDPTLASAMVEITDNDVPIIRIREVDDAVVEGSRARFELSSDSARFEDLTVKFTLSQQGDFLFDTPGEKIRPFSAGGVAEVRIIEFNTNVVDTDQNGWVQVELIPDVENYALDTINTNRNSARVVILDSSDSKIYVSINADQPTYMSGQHVSFTLSARNTTGDPIPDFVVAVDIDTGESSDIILWRVPTAVLIVGGRGTFKFYTKKSSNGGIITATVVEDTARYVLLKGSDQVTINSETPSANEPDAPAIAVASIAANMLLNMNLNPDSGNAQPNHDHALSRPEVSIVTITQSVEEGETVQFQISRLRELDSNLSVTIAISSTGNAVPTSYNSTVVLASNQPNTLLEVPTHDDYIAEETDSVFAEIIQSPLYSISDSKSAIATVLDTHDNIQRRNQIESANQYVVPALLNATGTSTHNATNNHLSLALANSLNTGFNLGGASNLRGLVTNSGHAVNEESLSLKSVLSDSSFVLSLAPEQSGYNIGSVWGLGDQVNIFERNSAELYNLEGEVFIGHLGADARLNQDSLLGLQVSISEAELIYQNFASEDIDYTVNSNVLSSYYGWSSAEHGLEVRVIGSYGYGDFIINQADYTPLLLDSRLYSTSFSGIANIASFGNHRHGLSSINLKAESSFLQFMMQDDTNYLTDFKFSSNRNQLVSEYSYQKSFAQGSVLSSVAQIGGVWGKDEAIDGLGVEFLGSIDLSTPIGVTFKSSGMALIADENAVEKVATSNSISYDHGNDGLGLNINVSSKWGQTSTIAQKSQLTSNLLTSNNESEQYTYGTQVNSKVGYGFVFGEDFQKLTIYSGYEFNDLTADELLLGSRISIGSNFRLDIEGIKELRTSGDETSKLQLNGRLNW